MTRPQLAATTDQIEFARIIRSVCTERFADAGEDQTRPFEPELWRRLGDLGAWSVTGSGGTFRDVGVVAEALGLEALAGPVSQTYAALDMFGHDAFPEVADGSQLVTLADEEPIVPWGTAARHFVLIAEFETELVAAKARPESALAPVVVLGEPWARGSLQFEAEPRDANRAIAVGAATLAAYLNGVAGRLLEITIDYSGTREQFGRSILSNQAVSHRLARLRSELEMSVRLTELALDSLDDIENRSSLTSGLAACARRLASDVSLGAGFLGHQLHGGIGYVDKTLLSTLTRRAQLGDHLPPGRRLTNRSAASLGIRS